jgi:AcrR family transcriptional regulator
MSTRDKILNAALELFNKHGTAAVSTNHIAAEIGISPGNLYYHFRNKEDIISALFERLFSAWDETFQLPLGRAPELVDFEAMIAGNYQIIWEYQFIYREMAALLRNDPDLHARYLEVRHNGYRGFLALIDAFANAGILKRPDNPDELMALTELCWIVSELWPVNLELSGRNLDSTGVKEGIALMHHLFRPYMISSGGD